MIEIKDLLLSLNNKLLSSEIRKETIRGVISEVIKVQINSNDVELKGNTVYLNIKPIYKNEIFLKKDLINKKLEENLGKKSPKEIR